MLAAFIAKFGTSSGNSSSHTSRKSTFPRKGGGASITTIIVSRSPINCDNATPAR